MLVTGGTLPSGRHEAVAVRIGTAMNELRFMFLRVACVVMSLTHELIFCGDEIVFESDELLDLCVYVLDLGVNVLDEAVMGDGGLCGGKHGAFLREENVLLVSCEWALKEGLSETDVLNLRMGKGGVAEHALWNGNVIAAEESFVASSASFLGTDIKRAGNGFAIGGIECVSTDGTSRIGHIDLYLIESLKEVTLKEKRNQFFKMSYKNGCRSGREITQ